MTIQAKVDIHWHDRVVDVWFYESKVGYTLVYYWKNDGTWTTEKLEQGSVLPENPSLRMSRELLEALVSAVSDVLPPDAAVDRHLKDAIGIRDRLLTIIERKGAA